MTPAFAMDDCILGGANTQCTLVVFIDETNMEKPELYHSRYSA